MPKIHSYIPITNDINKDSTSQFLSSFFYCGPTRYLIVENKPNGELTLTKCKAPLANAQRGLKIGLIFTLVIPLIAALWAFCRFLHVKCSAKKWTLLPSRPKPVPGPKSEAPPYIA